MKKLFSLLLILPMLVYCNPENSKSDPDEKIDVEKLPTDPYSNPIAEEDLPAEIHDGDVLLATNPNVEKFLTEVNYEDKNYTTTLVRNYYGGFNGIKYNENGEPDENGELVSEPVSDIPPKYTIRWEATSASEQYLYELKESDWKLVRKVNARYGYVVVTNLVPQTTYTYKISSIADPKLVVAKGSFTTTGHLHQVFFNSAVRNGRDLGGWKTLDGKTVRYHKIYRGGRLQTGELNKQGRSEVLWEGIGAQLDLRGGDKISKSPVDGVDFLAPGIETGGTTMLNNYTDKTKQCFEFVVNSLRAGKPVYFHCSLGRDRTGTLGILLLGLLGVREGDISKEYEVTYFAPMGYSVSSSEDVVDGKTWDERHPDLATQGYHFPYFLNTKDAWVYSDVVPFFWSKAGKNGTFAEGVEKYLLSIGVAQKDINDFRKIMLK